MICVCIKRKMTMSETKRCQGCGAVDGADLKPRTKTEARKMARTAEAGGKKEKVIVISRPAPWGDQDHAQLCQRCRAKIVRHGARLRK